MRINLGVDRPSVMGIVGRSGSGKTTLLTDLIPELTGRGLSVSTIKHTHHDFDMDQPGKDSYRHREAGAREVLLTSARRWALLHELQAEPEPDMDELLERMSPVDVLLVEGFKSHAYPKVEVHRPAAGHPLLAAKDTSVVAVATDATGDAAQKIRDAVEGRDVVLLDLDQTHTIADSIVGYINK